MQNDVFETLSQLSETTLENYRKLGENNLKLGEKLLQEQTELTAALFEASKSKTEKVAGAKDFQSLAAQQAELVQECSELVWASLKNSAEVLSDAAKFYNHMFEAGLKNANVNAVPKAAKTRKSA